LTDPPYGHRFNDGDLAHKRQVALGLTRVCKPPRPIAGDGPEAGDLVRALFREARRLLKPGCCCCCCCGGGGPDPQFARWSSWMDEELEFKQAVVWDKGGLGLGWHYRRNYELMLVGQVPGGPGKWYGGHSQPNIVRIPRIVPQKHHHPTQKPLALMQLFVRLHSAPGDLILDPFMGSGTTLVAAQRLGRRAIGIDVERRWCRMAKRRLAGIEGMLCWTARA
jgi:site-specific DNA-methyltransferase (adenine-specific)